MIILALALVVGASLFYSDHFWWRYGRFTRAVLTIDREPALNARLYYSFAQHAGLLIDRELPPLLISDRVSALEPAFVLKTP